MKILQIMAGGKQGGAETAFVDMCLALQAQGDHVEVVTRANDLRVPQLEAAGLKVHTARFGGRFDIFTKYFIRKIIRAFQPEIVQTWMARACQHTPRWTPGLHVPRYNVVARLGGYYTLKYFRAADYFITITPMIRDYLISHGVAPDRVRHINNFAEMEDVIVPVRRADHATPDNAVLLLALSRLHPAKALDILIKAVAGLPNVFLWIAGEGPSRPALEKLIVDLGVADRVTLLGWRDDRAALLQACDICVFPSRYEPFGTVFVQAWAARRPVIVSDADGPKQFVRDREDGLVFKIDDVAGLQDCINRLIQNRNIGDSLVQQGFGRYEAEFSRDKNVAAYCQFYADIRVLQRGAVADARQKV